jgi:hypothetical protein
MASPAIDAAKEAQLDELELYLTTVANIDPLNINDEFVRIPSDIAYCNALYSDARKDKLYAELVRTRTVARLRIEHRERLLEEEKKATEGMISSAVEDDDRYQLAYQAEIDAEIREVRYRGVCEALRAKKDALISLGAQYRAEMDSDPMVKKTARDAASFTNNS